MRNLKLVRASCKFESLNHQHPSTEAVACNNTDKKKLEIFGRKSSIDGSADACAWCYEEQVHMVTHCARTSVRGPCCAELVFCISCHN